MSGEHQTKFLMPSPVPTRRTRTLSQSERALQGSTFHGTIKSFCRQRGHGFIAPVEGGEAVFVHISDIEGEFVPKEGDEVSYKKCPIPPKFEKISAVHVRLTHLAPGSHDKWDNSLAKPTP